LSSNSNVIRNFKKETITTKQYGIFTNKFSSLLKFSTRIFFILVSFNPYANAAAVGSFIIRKTSNPAIVPASFVDERCASLKYAGTVITAFFI
jgi:hypothetical protein